MKNSFKPGNLYKVKSDLIPVRTLDYAEYIDAIKNDILMFIRCDSEEIKAGREYIELPIYVFLFNKRLVRLSRLICYELYRKSTPINEFFKKVK